MSETDPNVPADIPPEETGESVEKPKWSFRKEPAVQFLLRGLAISLPSILTIVILIWVLNGINNYIVQPTSYAVQWSIAQFVDSSIQTDGLTSIEGQPPVEYVGTNYIWEPEAGKKLQEWLDSRNRGISDRVPMGDAGPNGSVSGLQQLYRSIFGARLDETALDEIFLSREAWQARIYVPVGKKDWAVPYRDYKLAAQTAPEQMPKTTSGIYTLVVADRYFGGWLNLTFVMIVLLIVALYFLGRLVTVQLGSWAIRKVETSILGRLPIVSNVYSSVKQITDFLFTERSVEYSRVVAVEYPRKGIWSLALVTGEGMLKVTGAASEPLVTILVPSSPMPVTGYTMMVPRSSVVDLNITIDQAFQFCISCGVLVPDSQRVSPEALQRELSRKFSNTSHHITISPPPAGGTSPSSGRVIAAPPATHSGEERPPTQTGEEGTSGETPPASAP